MKTLRLLNVEDSEDDSALLLRHLVRGGYEVSAERVQTAQSMKAALVAQEWDFIISDYQMPNFSGLDALKILKDSGLDIPFIIISGTIGEDKAVQAMIAGVNDYLMKNNLARLIPAIERELKDASNRKAQRIAEKDLKESKKRLQLALSAAGLGVWEWNLQTNDVYWSPECYDIVNSENFNHTFLGFVDLLHPDDVDYFKRQSKEAIDNKKNFVAEFRIINRHGKIQWMANYGLAEYDSDGKPHCLIGTVQDITQRKQSEVEIRESEEKFRALVQATTKYVWTSGAYLKTEMFPEWWTELTGQSLEEARNWGWMKTVHPDDREETRRIWQSSFEQNSLFDTVVRILTTTGDYGYFAARAVPIFNSDGSLRRWIGAFNDITDRKRGEEQLRQSEQRFRTLISATAQIVWTANPDGVILTAHTPYGESIKGARGDINEEWLSRVHPNDRDRVLKEFLSAVQNKTNYECEYQMLYFDKQYHHFIARGMPVFEKDGNVREWIGTLTDITESKLADAKLVKKDEQLKQAQKLESIGRLAGGIAHDFNNMLTVINGYSDLVIRGLSIDDPLRRKIEEIKTAGDRAAELTNQLLAFSRRQILQTKVLDVNQIISNTTVMLQRLIGEDIQVIEDLAANLNRIEADSGQLSQIIMNLVINSRDAMPHGGSITIKTENAYLDQEFVNQNIGANIGDYVLLKISDTGIGMDEEIKNQIFEPFFTTKEIGHGTGLGLSTVYGIVKQFGGYISVKSSIGNGSTFEIYLPSLKETDTNLEKPKVLQGISQGTETILLVEDEELVRKLTRQCLEVAGYKVIEAQDGFAAIDICEQTENKIDLLITDVVMPKMSGRELAQKLATICPLVLFTSGYTNDSIMRHGVLEENINFLQKPFTLDEITNKVRELLDSKIKVLSLESEV